MIRKSTSYHYGRSSTQVDCGDAMRECWFGEYGSLSDLFHCAKVYSQTAMTIYMRMIPLIVSVEKKPGQLQKRYKSHLKKKVEGLETNKVL